MGGYIIEIRVGVGTGESHSTLHSWVQITRPDGSTEAWGLYPKEKTVGNIIDGPGEVRAEDAQKPYTASTGPIAISDSQYYDFRRYLPTFPSQQSPNYSIPLDQQCTQWALGALMAAGVLPKIPTELFPTHLVNPLTLSGLFPYLKLEGAMLNSFIDAFNGFFDILGHAAVDAIDAIKSLFGSAEVVLPPYNGSPLILDLDGDGVETTGVKAGTYFDHGGDGFAEETGWVGKDDGLLVLDRNHNGLIDNGKELFGNNTLLAGGQKAANGFAALAELDANHDGKIDIQDAAFADLRIWKDEDGDGVAQTDELLTLTEMAVRSLDSGYMAQIEPNVTHCFPIFVIPAKV